MLYMTEFPADFEMYCPRCIHYNYKCNECLDCVRHPIVYNTTLPLRFHAAQWIGSEEISHDE